MLFAVFLSTLDERHDRQKTGRQPSSTFERRCSSRAASLNWWKVQRLGLGWLEPLARERGRNCADRLAVDWQAAAAGVLGLFGQRVKIRRLERRSLFGGVSVAVCNEATERRRLAPLNASFGEVHMPKFGERERPRLNAAEIPGGVPN